MLSKSFKGSVRLQAQVSKFNSLPALSQSRDFSDRIGSTLSQNNQLFISKVILNKQLAYLQNPKISKALKPSDNFIDRHLGNPNKQVDEMLSTLDVSTIDELMDQTVPASIRLKKDHAFKHNGKELIGIHSETMMLNHLREFAMNNKVYRSF